MNRRRTRILGPAARQHVHAGFAKGSHGLLCSDPNASLRMSTRA